MNVYIYISQQQAPHLHHHNHTCQQQAPHLHHHNHTCQQQAPHLHPRINGAGYNTIGKSTSPATPATHTCNSGVSHLQLRRLTPSRRHPLQLRRLTPSVNRAKKFEDLVEPSADTEEKLKRLFEIPERERASCSETIISEASFSSEFTPVMSSVPPPSSGKFSLEEVKARIMKKKQSEKPEKSEQDVIPNPLPVVATHSKSSVKKRKAPDSVTGFDNFDGLSVFEVKERINFTLNLGYERIIKLMKEQEADLRETRFNLKELSIEHQKLKDSHAQEIEKLLTQAGEEKKKILEEAKESATNSVYQAMADMAREAADHGFTLDHWDYLGLDESAKLKAIVADPQETQAAQVDEGRSGDAGGKVTMGDDSENAKA